MKLLTKEQEAEHYRQTLIGGSLGGGAGLVVGFLGVAAAQRRFHFFRTLTLPLKAFLVTSAGTFAGIISADHYSRAYEATQNPKEMEYRQQQAERFAHENEGKTFTQRAMEFGKKERYKIVGGSWVASIAAAFAIVNRDKYLTGAQKIVQARVYAQFLTVGVLIATAAFEIADQRSGEGRYETVRYVDPKDPDHKRMLEKQVEKDGGSGGAGNETDDLWKQMVKDEEERIKQQEEKHKQYSKEHEKKQTKSTKKQENGDKKEGKDDKKDEKKDDKKDDKKDKK